jgi:hypothetical protein
VRVANRHQIAAIRKRFVIFNILLMRSAAVDQRSINEAAHSKQRMAEQGWSRRAKYARRTLVVCHFLTPLLLTPLTTAAPSALTRTCGDTKYTGLARYTFPVARIGS